MKRQQQNKNTSSREDFTSLVDIWSASKFNNDYQTKIVDMCPFWCQSGEKWSLIQWLFYILCCLVISSTENHVLKTYYVVSATLFAAIDSSQEHIPREEKW